MRENSFPIKSKNFNIMGFEDAILTQAKKGFLSKLNLIKWEAAQWMQFVEVKHNSVFDSYTFTFLSSSYGIGFDVEVKSFVSVYGEIDFDFYETYNFFKTAKYSEYEK